MHSAATELTQTTQTTESAPGARTLCEAFQATAARYADHVAIRSPDDSVSITYGEYADRIRKLAAGLDALGVRRGDTIGIMLTNRPEFHLCDTAAIHLGATPFSIYNTSSPEQIAYLFGNADNDVVIAEQAFVERVLAAGEHGRRPSHLVCVDGKPDGAISLEELEALGREAFDFEAAWQAVEPQDVLTLIYTSGTTGPPKGVEITHANMLAQCRAVASVLPIPPLAKTTSYLPHAHIADRWASHYNGHVYGIEVTDVPDPRQVAQVLPVLRPTIWGSVPRVLEKLKAAVEAGIAAEPDEAKRSALQGAIELGMKKVRLEQAGRPVPAEVAEGYERAEEAVYPALRARLGLDRLEWLIVGAAPLPTAVFEFLAGIGLPVVEMLGMSEASCIVTVARPSEARVGRVGKPIPGLEVRLANDGELLLRGPTVMRGYRKDPERTAEALDAEGWLHTGDVAEIDDDGTLRIIDRKKELIINAAGKNMSPANIEGELKSASPLIGQAACIGDGRPYNVALLVLDPDAAAAYAQTHGLSDSSVGAVAADPGVLAEVEQAVARANERLSRVEQIKRFKLLADEWLPGAAELTPTMKLKRQAIEERYADVIEGLYAD